MNALQIFDYKGSMITFEKNGQTMVNVTDFAKAFPDKNLSDIVNGKEISEYIEALSKIGNSSFDDLLTVRKGAPSLGGGTWANSKVALRIAQKLSPEFAVCVDIKLEELLTTGQTSIKEVSRKELAQMIIDLENEKERLQLTTELQSQELQKQAPKVHYHDQVLQAENTHTSTTIAKELGMSAQAMHHILKQKGIIYFHENHWVLYAYYQNMGYTKTRTTTYQDSEGKSHTNIITVWTEKGREFLHKKFAGNLQSA